MLPVFSMQLVGVQPERDEIRHTCSLHPAGYKRFKDFQIVICEDCPASDLYRRKPGFDTIRGAFKQLKIFGAAIEEQSVILRNLELPHAHRILAIAFQIMADKLIQYSYVFFWTPISQPLFLIDQDLAAAVKLLGMESQIHKRYHPILQQKVKYTIQHAEIQGFPISRPEHHAFRKDPPDTDPFDSQLPPHQKHLFLYIRQKQICRGSQVPYLFPHPAIFPGFLYIDLTFDIILYFPVLLGDGILLQILLQQVILLLVFPADGFSSSPAVLLSEFAGGHLQSVPKDPVKRGQAEKAVVICNPGDRVVCQIQIIDGMGNAYAIEIIGKSGFQVLLNIF